MLYAFSQNPAGYVEPWEAGTGSVEPTEEAKAAAGTGYVEVKVPASSKTCEDASSFCKQLESHGHGQVASVVSAGIRFDRLCQRQ